MKAAKRVRGKKATKHLKKSKKLQPTKPLSGDSYLVVGHLAPTTIKPLLGDAYIII